MIISMGEEMVSSSIDSTILRDKLGDHAEPI